MAMKPAELQKFNAMKLVNRMKNSPGSRALPGADSAPVDRREQRRLDQAAGLVPFAVKLNGDLIRQIHALASQRKTAVNELVAELLQKALKK